MYERFTDRSRKVMQLANQEAQRFNHEYIGTEHILLGLIKEGSGVAANVLKNVDVDLRKVRLEVEKKLKTGPDAVIIGKLPQTPRAKKVIEFSIEAARDLNHNYVGTEHLLLGLVREKEGLAAQILHDMGVTETIVDEVHSLLGTKARQRKPETAQTMDMRRQMEQAIANQDFEEAVRLRGELDALTKQTPMPKIKEDASNDATAKLRKIACVLFLHFKGDWDALEALEEIEELIDE